MPKKVLIVTALAGFVRSFLNNDISILQGMGYEVHCAANANHKGANDVVEYLNSNNVVFHQVDFSSTSPFSNETYQSYKQIKKVILESRFDVIHCHTPIAGALTRIAARKEREKSTKVIYTTHGFYFHRGSRKINWLIYYNIEKFVSKFTDVMVTINKEDYENAKKMHCNDVVRISGVGVDTSKFISVDIDRDDYRASIGVSKNDIMLLSIGELSHRKNHQIIIKALAKLNNPNIIYIICGNSISGKGVLIELDKLARENNVRVKFLGLRPDIPQICHCADIGAFPSVREGLGLAGIETLVSGVPLVTSNVHGILDYMKDGKTGFTSDPYDVDGFVKGITSLLDSNRRKNMKDDCIKAALPFDRSISIEQMRKLYTKVAAMNRQ